MRRRHDPRSEGLASCALACAASLALLACAPETQSELLEVHAVAPERLEPGHALEIRGAGFPPGRGARVRLEGRMLRPGEAPREVSVDLRGRAASNEHVDARFTDEALELLGGRGTLHGSVVVSFEAVGHGAVVGRSRPVQLDIMPPSTERIADALARARRATMLAGELGLALGEEAPDSPGLPIEAVDESSPAARAGIAVADRVVAIDGVRVHAISDLLPPSGATRTTLELARAGEASTLEVRLPLASGPDALSSTEVRAAQVALVWALAIALLLAPSAALLDFIARPGRARGQGRSLSRHAPTAIRMAVGALFLASIVVLDSMRLLHVPAELVVAAVLAARTSAALLDGRGWARARAVLGALSAALLCAIGLGAAAVMAGTSDLAALRELGGAMPWEWPALRTPAGPLLALLLSIGGTSRAKRRTALAIEEAIALVLAGTTAAVLLGGWSAPFEGTAGRVVGALLYVVSGLACWAAMRKLGEVSARKLAVTGASLAVLSIVATYAWITEEPPDIGDALGEALTVVLAIAAVALLHRRITASTSHDPAPALPFL